MIIKIKKNKGITLIALIITIVILLILAVVTIMEVTGDGIISKAKEAKSRYEDEQDKENKILDKYLNYMNGLLSSSDNKDNDDNQEKTWAPIVDADGNNIIGKVISETENIPVFDELGNKIILPAGFKIISDETTNNACRISEGIVITDDVNEFVWVPVTTQIRKYGINTMDYREPDVVTKTHDTQYNMIDGADNDIKYLKIINDIIETSYSNSDEFLDDLEKDFESMAESVNKNGGFYVGRYETSIDKNQKNAQSIKGVPSATAERDSANTWYGLYAYQKSLYNDNSYSVQSTMMWGSQYDAMIAWMGNKANVTNEENRNKGIITGEKETDVIKNIYDIYGNRYEWTLEAKDTYTRVIRGAYYMHSVQAPSFKSGGVPTYTNTTTGSRLALYIK